MMFLKIIFFTVLIINIPLTALKLDRVILSSDTNALYLPFWPLVARVWQEIVGVKPTLALIAPSDVIVDESVGDVIRFEPLSGIPTSLQAQVIRLLAPAYYPDEVCIISDIDMIPLSKQYFQSSVEPFDDTRFVVFKDGAYAGLDYQQYPMCYNAAKGKVFKEIFHIDDVSQIPAIIKEWASLGLGWNTDEKMLYSLLHKWTGYQTRCVKLGHSTNARIDRSNWGYDKQALKAGYYCDCHMLRPLNAYAPYIIELLNDLEFLKK